MDPEKSHEILFLFLNKLVDGSLDSHLKGYGCPVPGVN